MRDVWRLTFAIILFGVGNGGFLTATPQACLQLGLPSDALGLIGTGLPLGYALSCLLLGQLLARFPGKHVMIFGAICAGCAMFSMWQAKTTAACVASQLLYGVACGAFWPFASAWMLDFQSEGVARTRLLRHYNVAWTSGTALGMLLGGFACKYGFVFQTLAVCGCTSFLTALFSLTVRKTMPASAAPIDSAHSSPAGTALRLGFPILAAAALANIMTLSLRGVILNNYAELNASYGFQADRMGVLNAVSLGSQLTAFFIGAMYEKALGFRRIYTLMAASLILISLGFAFRTELSILILLSIAHGFVNALAFQAGLVAATSYFSRARTGTTVHEAVVGIATMSPLPAGWLIATLKSSGTATQDALRAPLLAAAAIAVLGLIVQHILVSSRFKERQLLPQS